MSEIIQLYRYLIAEAAIKTIETRSLRVGRFKEFNDPFELKLGIDRLDQLSRQEIEQEKQTNEVFLNSANEKFGVHCFSSVVDEPILWSHYADSHYGLVIEVKCKRESVFQVTYDKPCLPTVPTQVSEAEKKRILVEVLAQKAPAWKYEQEWRGVVDLDACRSFGGSYFKEISGDDIVSVTIGCRSSVSPNYVRRALDANGWKEVRVGWAHLSLTEYKVELEYEPVRN